VEKLEKLRLVSYFLLIIAVFSVPSGIGGYLAYAPYLIYGFLFTASVFGYYHSASGGKILWALVAVNLSLATSLSFVVYLAGYGPLLFPVTGGMFCALYLYIITISSRARIVRERSG
jgi:hypothetical protein